MHSLSLASRFSLFASAVARYAGHPVAFAIAVLCLVAWGACGPALGFSEGWQLTVNTGTTIVTFLMVFVIQNSQNRDSKAVQTKLDELIRAVSTARNSIIDIEDLPDEDIEDVRARLCRLGERSREAIRESSVAPASRVGQ